jgi:hypothetical protein
MALVVLLVGDEKVRACDDGGCASWHLGDGKQTPSNDDTTSTAIILIRRSSTALRTMSMLQENIVGP